MIFAIVILYALVIASFFWLVLQLGKVLKIAINAVGIASITNDALLRMRWDITLLNANKQNKSCDNLARKENIMPLTSLLNKEKIKTLTLGKPDGTLVVLNQDFHGYTEGDVVLVDGEVGIYSDGTRGDENLPSMNGGKLRRASKEEFEAFFAA